MFNDLIFFQLYIIFKKIIKFKLLVSFQLYQIIYDVWLYYANMILRSLLLKSQVD